MLNQWLSVSLFDAGFRVDAAPGARVRLRRAELVLEPEQLLNELASGKLSAEAWTELCARIHAAGAAPGAAEQGVS